MRSWRAPADNAATVILDGPNHRGYPIADRCGEDLPGTWIIWAANHRQATFARGFRAAPKTWAGTGTVVA